MTPASLFDTQNPMYEKRKDTDSFFVLPMGAMRYHGAADRAARLIEEFQLKDAELWKLFVDQFRSNVDDADDGWRSEYWGKMMRGACFTYAYTGDQALYGVLCETVRDLLTAQDGLGRWSSYSVEREFRGWDIWGRKYILLGLQYFYEICFDEALREQIVTAMCRSADYMIEKLGGEEDGKLLITKATSHWYGLNSSSLLEPIVRLYLLTKSKRYLDFASYIVDCGGTSVANIFELALEDNIDPYQYPVTKAYEMMSCFEGLLEYYRVTGIEKWRTAVVNFAKRVLDSDITIIGCAGCTHELFDHARERQTNTEYIGIMQETCVTVTWMKFCFQLLCLTGGACFADAMEVSLYNALLGAVNTEKNTVSGGLPFDSYSPLLPGLRAQGVGGRKTIDGQRFYGCCAAIGAAGTGLVPHAAVMATRAGAAVNLYLPGTVRFQTPSGRPATLSVDTAYPVTGQVVLTLALEGQEDFELCLRIPAYSINTSLRVENCEVKGVQPGTYCKLSRTWSDGDEIHLSLDLTARLVKPFSIGNDPNAAFHAAVLRGPVVLARDARLGEPVDQPVDIAADGEGHVAVMPTDTADFDRWMEFRVPLAAGGAIHMIDYASAGKTWEQDSMMCAWMPTKNYWAYDLAKPVLAYCGVGKKALYAAEDGTARLDANHAPDALRVVSGKENVTCDVTCGVTCSVTLMLGKAFLAVNPDGAVVLTDEQGPAAAWDIEPFVQNRVHIRHRATGKYLCEAWNSDAVGLCDRIPGLTALFRLYQA